MSEVKKIYNKASSVQYKMFNEKRFTKAQIYQNLSPYYETQYIDKFFKSRFMQVKEKGKQLYYIPASGQAYLILWKDEYSWTAKTKITHKKTSNGHYLIITEKVENFLDGPYYFTMTFKKYGNQYKVSKWGIENI